MLVGTRQNTVLEQEEKKPLEMMVLDQQNINSHQMNRLFALRGGLIA